MKALAKFWISVVKACRHLSLKSRWRLARIVAFFLWWAIPKRRRITLTNLRLCFPQLTESERTQLARQIYRRLARAALDHGTLWCGSQQEVQSFVRFKGIENILNPEFRPTIVVAPHFAGLDAAGIALNTYVRGVSLYQKQSNPYWDQAMFDGRKRFSDPILIAKSEKNDLKPILKAMKEGYPFYYLPDMDHGKKNSVFVPFFGQQAATIPMVSRIAKLLNAKVIWCIATMTDTGYEVEITPPMENFPTEDYVADTARLNEMLESRIREHPDQYLWVHRRFKTRPDGEPSVY